MPLHHANPLLSSTDDDDRPEPSAAPRWGTVAAARGAMAPAPGEPVAGAVVAPPVAAMSGDGSSGPDEVWDRLQQLPSMNDDPLVWDHRAGGFVRSSQVAAEPGAPAPRPPAPAPDPTMVAPRPPAAEPNRWGQGVVGAGTAKRHVVIDAGAGAGGTPAGAAPAARPAPAPVGPAPAPSPARGGVASPRAARPAAPPAAAPPRARRPRRRRRIGRTLVILFVLVPALLVGGAFAFGWVKFSQIPRVPVADVLSPASGTGTNILVVGTDSREGINPGDPNADAFIGEPTSGARTDSIMVLRVAGGQQSLLSIPRDLWVTDPATGQLGRINATYNAGPANLIQAVQNLGIPVQHYVEINFVSFGKLVDAVGGIDVTFAFPARDTNSGLDIPEAGTHHLDGTQALAYVRSRHYQELKDGEWVEDPLSDLGRVARQRAFLSSLLTEVSSSKNPFEISSITDAMAVGMKIDDAMTFLDAIRLAWAFRGGFAPTSDTLPVTPRTTSGGAAVLDLNAAEAAPLIQRYQ